METAPMTADTIAIALHGASGRMGRRISALAADDPSLALVLEIDRENKDVLRVESAEGAASPRIDVVIDFSVAAATPGAITLALDRRAALLVGTTGLDAETVSALRLAAEKIPVLIAPNTSPGVAVVRHLAREATRLLGGFQIDIVEMHHAAKLDAPSGTARSLASAVADGGVTLPPDRIHAVRAGDIVGEHTVQFAGPGEVIRIAHGATSRDLFAAGALRAARWLKGRAPGLYTIEQSLGLLS